jgi:hypothetical protein
MASTSSYVQQEWNMNKPAKKEPIFTKVAQLKPGTKGHTLIAKVLSSQTVDQPAPTNFYRTPQLADCLIGDETGTIIFTAHHEQGPNLLLFHVILISHFLKIKTFDMGSVLFVEILNFFHLGFSHFDLHCFGIRVLILLQQQF